MILSLPFLVQSLVVNNFYAGEGTDNTGVPTKLVTMNCTLKLIVYNHAGTFGIHAYADAVQLKRVSDLLSLYDVHR